MKAKQTLLRHSYEGMEGPPTTSLSLHVFPPELSIYILPTLAWPFLNLEFAQNPAFLGSPSLESHKSRKAIWNRLPLYIYIYGL